MSTSIFAGPKSGITWAAVAAIVSVVGAIIGAVMKVDGSIMSAIDRQAEITASRYMTREDAAELRGRLNADTVATQAELRALRTELGDVREQLDELQRSNRRR